MVTPAAEPTPHDPDVDGASTLLVADVAEVLDEFLEHLWRT
jgi:hypothetical protein